MDDLQENVVTSGDVWPLYRLMLKSRRFEEAVEGLWDEGKISGEMHLGIGEEAIVAGVVAHLHEGDALALDHRGSPALVMRGLDPVSLLLEFLGHADGLCGGHGGHMHLFSKEHLCASSGIVGSVGPAATGFALAARYRKSDHIAVAFFGEGALNQGMLMESMNLASVWRLPVLFVCKDNALAITTVSSEVTGGTPLDRAKGFGIDGAEIDGTDVTTVWNVAGEAIEAMRKDGRPFFVHAHCQHATGHFLGDPLLRFHQAPLRETAKVTAPLMRSMVASRGESAPKRLGNVGKVLSLIFESRGQLEKRFDPIAVNWQQIAHDRTTAERIDAEVTREIARAVSRALEIHGRTGRA